MGKRRRLTEDDKRLKKALEPFLRAYRVSILPFQGNNPDPRGLRDVLPRIWPTVDDLRALVGAAVANNMDYENDEDAEPDDLSSQAETK